MGRKNLSLGALFGGSLPEEKKGGVFKKGNKRVVKEGLEIMGPLKR